MDSLPLSQVEYVTSCRSLDNGVVLSPISQLDFFFPAKSMGVRVGVCVCFRQFYILLLLDFPYIFFSLVDQSHLSSLRLEGVELMDAVHGFWESFVYLVM